MNILGGRTRPRHAFFAPSLAGAAALWRLSVQSTAPYADLGGDQLIEWGGALRWLIAGERTVVREGARLGPAHGGHATLFRARDRDGTGFAPLDGPVLALHRKLKAVFDPHGILNRGRLLADL